MDDALFFQKMTTLLMEEPPQEGYLVTLCDYARSSPQPKGAMWFYHIHTQIGSLSSGCLERILANLFEQQAFQQFPFFLRISQKNTSSHQEKKSTDTFWYQSFLPFLSLEDFLMDDTQYSFLPCQGSLVLLIEKIHFHRQYPHAPCLFSFYQKLTQDLAAKKNCQKKISFTATHEAIYTHEISLISPSPKETTIEIEQSDQQINYKHQFGIRYPLVLIGWNAVAFYIAKFAPSLQFELFICEPRFQPKDVPNDVTWIPEVPDVYLQNHFQSKPYAIIALSHEAALDDIALLEAIDSNAYYIGALGSKRTAQKRIDRLLSLGLDPNKVQRIQSPVGLDLKSKWPAEIAISILAELIKIRNQTLV